LDLIANLYNATADKRRFLESRLLADPGVIEQYRRTTIRAIYPDPLSRRPISVREASAAITHYRRATGDSAGTADLSFSVDLRRSDRFGTGCTRHARLDVCPLRL
jgi:hypothetical protein